MFYTTLLYFVLLFTFLNLHFKSKMELILGGKQGPIFPPKTNQEAFQRESQGGDGGDGAGHQAAVQHHPQHHQLDGRED